MRPKRIPTSIAVLSLPGVAVLAGLAVLDALAPLHAVAGSILVAAGATALQLWHLGSLRALRCYVERLRASGDADSVPDPPTIHSPGLDPDLVETLAETARERQQRRTELRKAAERLRTVLAALPDPLLMLDADARVVSANPAARRLFGEAVERRPLPSLLRHPDLLNAADRVLSGAATDETVEFTLQGEVEQTFAARATRLPAPGPDDSAAIILLHDVTAIRRAERMRADFVANASHELRTPLSSLLGFVETLQGAAKDDPEAPDRFLPIMHEQAQRMSNVLEDLLSLSRIELDEHAAPETPVDLGPLLDRVREGLTLRAAGQEMAIEISGADALPPILGDTGQLTQVFQNLVDNAIKYGRTGTTVTVRAEDAGPGRSVGTRGTAHAVAVSVIDAGEGIPRQHIPRLTERFYRVDKARSRDLGGTGLGLAIVKHIVARHRGRLEIASEEGVGSRFTVYLPVAGAASGANRAAA